MLKTRFVCESCGNDVPYNAEVCSFCGRKFSGIKCPVCKRSGRPEIFRSGCPGCGYLSPEMDNLAKTETVKLEKKHRKKRIKKKDSSSIYILLSVLLIMIISVLVILIIKGNL